MSANVNVKPSEMFVAAAAGFNIDPQTATSTATSSWTDVRQGAGGSGGIDAPWLTFVLHVGATLATTAVLTFQQATSVAGANAKSLLVTTTCTVSAAHGLAQCDILIPNAMDLANSFYWLQATVTVGGSTIVGVSALYGPAWYQS